MITITITIIVGGYRREKSNPKEDQNRVVITKVAAPQNTKMKSLDKEDSCKILPLHLILMLYLIRQRKEQVSIWIESLMKKTKQLPNFKPKKETVTSN